MEMGIKVEGLEKARRWTEEMANALKPATLVEWANRIERTVKTECNDQIIFKGEIDKKGEFHFEFKPFSNEDIDCVIRAIRRHMVSMHPATQRVYENLIKFCESKRVKPVTQS